jgi:hypothetical protein
MTNKNITFSDNKDLGFFILIINPNNSCFFIYFDIKSNLITKYEFHKGTSFYKDFNAFVSETIDSEISEMENKKGMQLYVPKNYLNKSITARCETLGLELIKYLDHDKNRPEFLKNIKLYFKSYNLTKANFEKFKLWVSKLNSSLNSTSDGS